MWEEKQWEEALQAVKSCSFNVTCCLSQLYILLRVHFTSARIFILGLKENPKCTRCSREHDEPIHLLCRLPKLHLY